MNTKVGLAAGRPSANENRKVQAMAELAQISMRQVRVNFDLDEDEHVRLKVYAAQNKRTVAEILRDLIDKHIPK